MHEQLLGFCNDLLRDLKVTREQIEAVGGADGFARLVGQSFARHGLRLATIEPAGGERGQAG